MSAVTLLAADHPLPLYEAQTRRVRIVSTDLGPLTVEEDGFSVQEHRYYRWAVDQLGLPVKPYQYELDLRATEEDASQLRAYLEANCTPGEQVEVWNLWVGDGPGRVRRFSGALSQVALDTLEQLEEQFQTCLTIRI